MKRNLIVLLTILVCGLTACKPGQKKDGNMEKETKLKIEEKIIDMLKTVYDPEIPVNVYDLGLIYKIDLQENGELTIDMTLTAPNCPAADFIMEDVLQGAAGVLSLRSEMG